MLAGKSAIRVGELLQKEIALLILEKVKDPRVKNVTITGVQVSDDLKLARIYFSFFGKNNSMENAKEGLESAKGFIKREIGLRLDLKYIPDITFMYDYSLESGNRINRLIEELETNNQKKIHD